MTDDYTLDWSELGRRRVMVAWSGGLDSTWCLYKLLAETDARVHAHFVGLPPRFREAAMGSRATWRGRWEADAVRKLVPLLSTVRPFGFTRSFLDLSSIGSTAADSYWAIFLAAMAAHAEGFGDGDIITSGLNDEGGSMLTPPADLPADRWPHPNVSRADHRALVRAAFRRTFDLPQYRALTPLPSRLDQLTSLPDAIADAAHSCRFPEGATGEACGKCKPCHQIEPVRQRLASGAGLIDFHERLDAFGWDEASAALEAAHQAGMKLRQTAGTYLWTTGPLAHPGIEPVARIMDAMAPEGLARKDAYVHSFPPLGYLRRHFDIRPASKQVWTAVAYFDTSQDGDGAMVFPEIGLTVAPVLGKIASWRSKHPDGTVIEESAHEIPPLAGTPRWSLTCFYEETK